MAVWQSTGLQNRLSQVRVLHTVPSRRATRTLPGIHKDICFHTSRHTYATMLLTLGADLFTVCKLLGHRSVRSTQIYAKIIDRKKDDAANRPDAIFINDTSSNT